MSDRSKAWHLIGVVLVVAVIVALGAPAVSAADDDEGQTAYTAVALWQADRAHWGDLVEMFEKYDQPIMEKLYADGVISEWGIDADLLHAPDEYTHSTWYSAPSMGALMKAGEAYTEAWKALGEEGEKADSEWAELITKHRDMIINTRGQRSAGADLDSGYFHGANVLVKSDKDRTFHGFWNARIKPVYEQLLADGAIVAYGFSSEAVTTGDPGRHMWWYVTASADGLDAVEDAFDASWEELDEEGRRARWVSIMDLVEEGSYREWMTRIIHMQITEQ